MAIIKNFSISKKAVNVEKTTATVVPINHIFVVDVSGSMSYELQLIRKQLKNKLPSLVKENDTISIIWFSGKRDAGILKEEVEIQSLKSLQDLNDSIDKWLRPVGLTAFAKPLELTVELVQRIQKNRPESAFSLMFLTDGYNNDCSWSDVEKSLETLEQHLASSTYIEYGYYADTEAISKMASITGGESINADSFDEYDNIFEKKLTNSLTSFKKTEQEITGSLYDFAFFINENNEINSVTIKDGKVLVPNSTDNIYYFSKTDEQQIDETALYAASYIMLDKMMNNECEDILAYLGDKYIFDLFINAYGKQKINDVKNLLKECVVNDSVRYQQGKSSNLIIDDKAYCVMDLVNDLLEGDNYFYPLHESFNYKRIGQKRVQKTTLSEKDKKVIQNITDIEELKKYANSLTTGLTFEYSDKDKAHPLSDLVWNSERANLSVRVRYEGYVNLPENPYNIENVNTFIYRNYTIIKDGILNVSKMPVLLDSNTRAKLAEYITVENGYDILDFSSLPIINRGMVQNISATDLAKKEYELLLLKGETKVYNHYEKTLFERESVDFVDKYGKEGEQYLKELGITSFNGFAPKTENVESEDFYMSVILATKIKGLSSIPKVEDVAKKISENKDLKPSEYLLEKGIKNYNTQTSSELYTTQPQDIQKSILERWVSTSKNNVRKRNRELMCDIAKIKFALILSKKWFKEFKNFDENTLSIDYNGQTINATFDMSMKRETI